MEKEEGVTQRNQKREWTNAGRQEGQLVWPLTLGAGLLLAFCCRLYFPHADKSLGGVQPPLGFKPPISSWQRVLSLGFSALEINS